MRPWGSAVSEVFYRGKSLCPRASWTRDRAVELRSTGQPGAVPISANLRITSSLPVIRPEIRWERLRLSPDLVFSPPGKRKRKNSVVCFYPSSTSKYAEQEY